MDVELRDSYGSFIDGDWRDVGEPFSVVDPATERTITTVMDGGPAGIDDAITVAKRSQSTWSEIDPAERGRILSDVADALREQRSRLVRIETAESGRPISQSEMLVDLGIRNFEYFAGIADKIEGETIPVPGDRLDYTRREPLGVTGHVIPWNASFVLASRSIAPALACGNTVVAKASPETPVSLLEMTRIASDAGIPDGVFNTVAGDGPRTGASLTSDDRLSGIVFTGSRPTGESVMKAAAENVVPVSLELGGKGPCLIFSDADIDQALSDMRDVYLNTGQICFATTRLFVHDEVYDEFVDRFAETVASLEFGPGTDDPDLGPLISAESQQNVHEMVTEAVSNGATVRAGGSLPDGEGHFYPATLLEDVSDDAPLSCEEVFGPVIAAYRFDDEREALERANDTRYGLSAAVWTNDLSRAHRLARELEAGSIMINEYPAVFAEAPFGGYKESGIGREKGQQAIEHYTQLKNVVVSLRDPSSPSNSE